MYSNSNAEQIILLDEARALLRGYAGRFRLRHCLSQPVEGAALDAVKAGKGEGEKLTRGRVDHKVLAQEFGGAWKDGKLAEHFLMIGTSDMERSVLGLLGRASLVDFSKARAAAAAAQRQRSGSAAAAQPQRSRSAAAAQPQRSRTR